ncbi:prolipoprotein diacylglyceryl transferase [Candidatus Chlamydia corallus]|uniref:prolipoprotein diacylglyceryl transferase n=1 Tax=Candidatus Chlamydia corallus TaxID=2038470 RepID=UPI000C2FDC24|nr:prolipoprotein diacylglyceryl transferase [Candidatus Chlamydia corallus]
MRAELAVIYWDHAKILWSLEQWPLRLTWYGLFFTIGIFLACLLGRYLALSYYGLKDHLSFSRSQLRVALENFFLYSILFIVPGARLAYVIFYGWNFYLQHPEEIIQVWHGGLSSHGGILGFILWAAIFSWIYRKKVSKLTFLFLTDLCGAVFGIAAFFIRLGNFWNQEIVGTPTSLPWGVVFSDPMQGVVGVPVHPVQLYEGISYLVFSGVLYFLSYKRYLKLGKGYLTSIVCMGVALIRFFAEYVKSHQGKVLEEDCLLSIGQILSIPLFVFGMILFIICSLRNRKHRSHI